MFYVTENDLRTAYAKEHFSTFTVPADAKLTPSARQFLIDFHIDFTDGYGPAVGTNGETGTDPAVAAARAEDAYASFADDVAVLGARLRMLGRNALGIDNDVAFACDALGSSWQQGCDLGSLLEDGETPEADEPQSPHLPALSAAVHPLYYEMALLDAELARTVRFWVHACGDMTSDGRNTVEAWAAGARRMRACLAKSIDAATKEAHRG